MIARAATAIRSLLGETCIGCGFTANAGGLCSPCRHDLPALKAPLCPICAEPVAAADTPCGRCLARKPHFDQIIAAREYAFPLDAMLQALKYHGDLTVARAAGSLLYEAVRYVPLPDTIVPMPLSRVKQRLRGFNQALEIARALDVPALTGRIQHVLVRVHDTHAQTGLSSTQRERNLRNAFRASIRLDGARVAVVDDVLTTGATMNEAARALKAAGAQHVSGWVVARTV